MIAIIAQIDWTFTNMSPKTNACKYELILASILVFFVGLKGLNQNSPIYNVIHNIHIHNTFVQCHQTWTCTHILKRKKPRNVDAKY
jgi:hypothetical protein